MAILRKTSLSLKCQGTSPIWVLTAESFSVYSSPCDLLTYPTNITASCFRSSEVSETRQADCRPIQRDNQFKERMSFSFFLQGISCCL
jgi:hypothetical protein